MGGRVDVAARSSSPIGRLVRVAGRDARYGEDFEAWAYVPDPLPSAVDLSADALLAVVDATGALARLDQASARLPNLPLFVRPAVRQEAISTSALEGTYATMDQLLEVDVLEERQVSAAVAEVNNYVRATEAAFDWVRERPITVGLLESLHSILVRGTRADTADAGRVRTTQVFVGASGVRVNEARFVPPPPGDQLKADFIAWADWVEAPDRLPTLVKVALAHYQFETLHPFNDGNGRLGRLVCVLQMVRRGDLRVPILSLSPWLEAHRTEYQDHLFNVSATGNFNPWIEFLCEGVRVQARRGIEKIDALHDWRQATLARLREERIKGVAVQIVEDLIGYPMITPTLSAKRYGVSYPAANTAIRALAEHGILEERSGRRHGRVFAANEVIGLINY
jgi:Fic family protein